MLREVAEKILEELRGILEGIDERQVQDFLDAILSSKRVFLVGKGRSGLMASAFASRLVHLGIPAWVVGSPTTPAIQQGDTLLAVTGTGETETVFDIVEKAKKAGAKILCITAKPESRIGREADLTVKIPAKTKTEFGKSFQPLGSPFEQSAFLFLEACVILLMKKLGKTEKEMSKKHTTLE